MAVQERKAGGGGKGGRGGQKKRTKGGSAKGGGGDGGWKVARALRRAPRPALDRRQHLQGRDRQRPARHGGGLRRHRPGAKRLPARRRDRPARGPAGPAPRPRQGTAIDELIKPRQEILVQVVKDPLKTKGARLTMQLSVAGRYLVYMPQGSGVGVSRRLPDKERDRLRKAARQGLRRHRRPDHPHGRAGRQEGRPRARDRLPAQAQRGARARAADVEAPALVFQEADLSVRVLRDVLQSEFEAAIIDDEKQHQRVTSFFQRTAPELVGSVELDRNKSPCSSATASTRPSPRRSSGASTCPRAAT